MSRFATWRWTFPARSATALQASEKRGTISPFQ
jgi:hypothetical protein